MSILNQQSTTSYKCSYCDYESPYRANIYRHCRAKHPEETRPKFPTLPATEAPAPPPSPPSDTIPPPPVRHYETTTPPIEEDGMSYSDLEDLIDCKIRELLAEKNIELPNGVRKSVIKSVMNSKGASVIAGLCVAYLLAMNLPIIMTGVKAIISKNSPVPSGGGVPLTQEEMMKALLARQQMNQMNQSVEQKEAELEPQLAD